MLLVCCKTTCASAYRIYPYFLFPVTQPVACSVALGTTVTLSAGDIIKFDHIFLDTHNYYNPDLGIFTIRTTGIYEINAAVYKATGDAYNDVQADLWLNYAQVRNILLSYLCW